LEHIRDNGVAEQLKRIACATILFVSSYIAVVYIDRLATYFSATAFGYHPTIHFWRISDLPTRYIEWSKERVLLIFTAGSASLFITITLLLLAYKKFSKSWAILKMFALWVVFNSLALLGANLGTSLFGYENYSSVYFNNFCVVFLWWGIPAFLLYFFLFLFSVILFIAGYAAVNMLLRFSHSQRLVKKYYGRLQVLLQLYVFPFILGSLLLIPFSFDNILFLAFHILGLTLLLIGMIARINDFYELHGVYRIELADNKTWLLIVFSMLLLLPVLNR